MGVFTILPNYNIPGRKSPIITSVNIDIKCETTVQNAITMIS